MFQQILKYDSNLRFENYFKQMLIECSIVLLVSDVK